MTECGTPPKPTPMAQRNCSPRTKLLSHPWSYVIHNRNEYQKLFSLAVILDPKILTTRQQGHLPTWWVRVAGMLGLLWFGLEFVTHLEPKITNLPRYAIDLASMIKHFTSGIIVGLLLGLSAKLSGTQQSTKRGHSTMMKAKGPTLL
jgi:hypothetical protein